MGLRNAWNALWGTTEQRDILSTDPRLEALLGGLRLPGGPIVNPHTAQNLATVLACISAISSAIAAAIAGQVFTETERQTHLVEFDLSALLRADPETRWASHKIAVEAQILTANEVREIEGFDPLPAGAAPTSASA